jgi:MtN3 and saliva related transmembrane protein
MRNQPMLDQGAGMRRLRDARSGHSRLFTYTSSSAHEDRAIYASAPPRAAPVSYATWIGWASSLILLATLIRQAYTQWKSHEVSGVSRWLFVGQVTASVGFTIYSLLLRNWVFASSNIAILMTAIAGEAIYLRNKRDHPSGEGR